MHTSTSEARLQANRRNSQRSTGPKTAEGKASSRRNALKHGLTATVVALGPDFDDSRPRPVGVGAKLDPGQPRPDWHLWLSEQVVRATDQIRRAQRVEGRLRDQAAWRATAVWDDDRKLDAEELGSRLGLDPSKMVARLRQTPQGCDWLITRWGWLVEAAEDGAERWTERQTNLAFDLLGIPEAGRTGSIGDPANLARAMVAELDDQRTLVAEADAIAQALAEADLIDVPTAELARLRRYEQALHRRLHWLLAELRADPLGQQSFHLGAQAHPTRLAETSTPPQGDGSPKPEEEPGQNEAKPSTSADKTKPTSPEGEPGQNEAKPSTIADKTKPTSREGEPAENEANALAIADKTKPTSPEPTFPPPRNRPDLARLAKRDRRNRREQKRNRQFA